MHFIGEMSAEEADALDEAYRRLTGRNPEDPDGPDDPASPDDPGGAR